MFLKIRKQLVTGNINVKLLVKSVVLFTSKLFEYFIRFFKCASILQFLRKGMQLK